MQKVLSAATKDSSHCTRGASWASALFEVAAAPFSSAPPSLSTPGMARSMTYFFTTVSLRCSAQLHAAGGAEKGDVILTMNRGDRDAGASLLMGSHGER